MTGCFPTEIESDPEDNRNLKIQVLEGKIYCLENLLHKLIDKTKHHSVVAANYANRYALHVEGNIAALQRLNELDMRLSKLEKKVG